MSKAPQWSQDVYVKAWDFASLAHHGQTYGGSIEGVNYDYVNHLGSVAMEVIWALQGTSQLNENLAVQCALLHDVIEDTRFTYEDIHTQFGQAVADGVLALTKNPDVGDKTAQMHDSLNRIQQQPIEIWMVKLADRITNLSPPPWYWQNEKILHYQQEAKLILTTLGSANESLKNRLQHKIDHYLQYLRAEN